MPLKIVATVSDASMAAHVGGAVEQESAVIEIPDDQIPEIVRRYFCARRWSRERKKPLFTGLSFSFLEDSDCPEE